MGNAYFRYPFMKFFHPMETYEMYEDKTLSIDEAISYFKTWSGYNIFLQKHPDQPDPAVELRKDLIKKSEI